MSQSTTRLTMLRHFVVPLLLAVSTAVPAQALRSGDSLVLDSSRSVAKVDVGAFSPVINMTWSGVERREVRVEQSDKLFQLFSDTGYVAIDKKSFAYLIGSGSTVLQPHTIESSFSALQEGINWETRSVTTGTPVSWCASTLETEVKSKFSVGKTETYKLSIDGAQSELKVLPVYEHGWWNRCVSGKIVRKFLYSPELQGPVSIEVAMYSSNGRDVNNSHMLRLTEVRRAKP